MARLGGVCTESFSSARECLSATSGGLAAILRDQKTMPSSSRSHVLLGLSSHPTPAAQSLSNSSARSRANSPIESSGFLDADDADDHKEDDICEANPRESTKSQSLKESLGISHSASLYAFNDMRSHGYDPIGSGLSRAHTHPQAHMHTHHQCPSCAYLDDVSRQHLHAVEGMPPGRHHHVDKGAGLCDSIVTTTASLRLSPLSKASDTPVRQALLTPSWTIPSAKRDALLDATHNSDQHQSAPVNVPSWSKMCKQPDSGASSSLGISISGEDNSERLPPHELLAREYAQSQRMTSSVCEGQGRTLKGRDMRRVRNAVWRQLSGFAD